MFTKIKYSFLKNHLKKPIYLILFVTSKCNLKCKHCFYSKKLNSSIPDLSLKEIGKFSQELGKLMVLNLTGGEPFAREDLFEIYKIFVKNNTPVDIAISTNGILTKKIYSDVSEMLKYGNMQNLAINLSLDGTEEIHNEIRGMDCYTHVIETYRKLVHQKEKYPQLSIVVSTVITNRNYKILDEFHKELKKVMPKLDFHNLEIMRGDPMDKHYNAPSIQQLEELKPVIFGIWGSYDYYKSRIKSRIAHKQKRILFNNYLKILKTKKQPWFCLAGKVHGVIDCNGDVSFCELLPKIGNLRRDSFAEIWNSEKADRMREFIKKRSCTCTHSCFQITNLVFNQFYWPRFII